MRRSGALNRREFLKAAALGALTPFVLAGKRDARLSGRLRKTTASTVMVDQSNPRAPNILFILTDDQPPHTVAAMEKTLARFVGGANLTAGGYVAVPLCGPARVCLLTGRYQHSHGITGNDPAFDAYRAAGHPHTDLLSRVKAASAGYRMGFFGKFINGYEHRPRFVHPAFSKTDRWVGLADGQGKRPYTVNNNGNLRQSKEGHTPFFGGWAEGFIRSAARESRPWFATLWWTDPHAPYTAQDIQGTYTSPGTKEKDFSDKSDYVLEQLRYGPSYHRQVYQGRGGEIERLDRWMETLFVALEETGQLESTVVIFSTDNGFMTGEHGGLTKKSLPYGESARVPFLVRGPGFGPLPEGSVPLVSHVDITRTICAVAGAETAELEGRDLRDLYTSLSWRKRLLVEMIGSEKGTLWTMLREDKWAYVDFRGEVRDKELYDLEADPYELENLAGTMPELEAELSARLQDLRRCAGGSCRTAEDSY